MTFEEADDDVDEEANTEEKEVGEDEESRNEFTYAGDAEGLNGRIREGKAAGTADGAE